MAGGGTASAIYSNTAEISQDYGATFQSLPNLPRGIYGNCVVIVGNKEQSVWAGYIENDLMENDLKSFFRAFSSLGNWIMI